MSGFSPRYSTRQIGDVRLIGDISSRSTYCADDLRRTLRKQGYPSDDKYIRAIFVMNEHTGVEVALVAKIAGHANPAVTLGIYTQAMRRGDAAAEALEKAYLA